MTLKQRFEKHAEARGLEGRERGEAELAYLEGVFAGIDSTGGVDAMVARMGGRPCAICGGTLRVA